MTLNPIAPATFSVTKAWLRALEATSELGEHSLATLPELIEERARGDGDALALISTESRLSYRQLVELSNRYARWALDEEIRVGDVVCLLMRNCPEYIAIWLGITHVGGVVALLNTNLSGWPLANCINIVTPKHVIVDASLLPAYRSTKQHVLLRCKTWIYGGDRSDSFDHIDDIIWRHSGSSLRRSERRPVTLSHRALLIYTSGTTGLPKAANVSHHRVLAWSNWFAGMLDVQSGDRIYDCLPLYHSVGGIIATAPLFLRGGAVVLREKFSAENFWRDVVESECTMFQYMGELCRRLVNAPPSGADREHKLRLCCGNGLRPDVWEKFRDRFRIPYILEFYETTEGNLSLYNVEGKPGAIGRVPPFLAHRFSATLIQLDLESGAPKRDSQGYCVKTRVNEIGEALARISFDGKGIAGCFEGYTSAAESNKKILRNVFAPGDAWFRTGDLMRQDALGFYHFVDRLGDTFRRWGENVATTEVAETLLAYPGIQQAVVYGVRVPGNEERAAMAALVVDESFDLADLHKHLAERLPECAHPLILRFCSRLDVAETFKQKKKSLIEEGFDPDVVGDDLYFGDRRRQAYVRLDSRLFAQIETGLVRL